MRPYPKTNPRKLIGITRKIEKTSRLITEITFINSKRRKTKQKWGEKR